jgi:hypothetical protein
VKQSNGDPKKRNTKRQVLVRTDEEQIVNQWSVRSSVGRAGRGSQQEGPTFFRLSYDREIPECSFRVRCWVRRELRHLPIAWAVPMTMQVFRLLRT